MTSDAQKKQTIWLDANYPDVVRIIDQRKLPFKYEELSVASVESMANIIKTMAVRGAGCIGVAAGFGMYLAALETRGMNAELANKHLNTSAAALSATRPTATNLSWAVNLQLSRLQGIEDEASRIRTALEVAQKISDDDVASCKKIGEIGLELIQALFEKHKRKINVLTHCNAGWLAFVKHGSATSPIYAAQQAGIPIHVFVGESRPRNQGLLTAWEMRAAGVEHTYVVDSAVGHLIQRGEVDIIFVGADRVTMNGDVANKIGTYLRALAAKESGVPFYVNFPSSTLDPFSYDGVKEVEIEERDHNEVSHIVSEIDANGSMKRILPDSSAVRNPAFDITPHQIISGLITERGLCQADPASLAALFPEHVAKSS